MFQEMLTDKQFDAMYDMVVSTDGAVSDDDLQERLIQFNVEYVYAPDLAEWIRNHPVVIAAIRYRASRNPA